VFRRLWEKLKTLWRLAKSERASPREIGWAVFWGVFAGCTPAVGVHGPLALGFATLFKKNRLWAWIGSRVSNMFFLPFIILAEVQLSHRIRTGTYAALDRAAIVEKAPELLLDWCLGTLPVGIGLGVALGLVAWGWARRRDTRRAVEEPAAAPAADQATG
jgi:uncharacterized protein (DUF2062 family)